ncbi:proton-conducting transporter transmembrane domain-containing protein [Rufibacter roseus]|uniref:Proton-conducting transporter membrane subunit n=1 Tax=Rufibacter roseus TaxID=1567108 RepID=A0ABW2DT55_9BACT|nr:proton-conducting transporter membrane subunit [Rufibacter roseus]
MNPLYIVLPVAFQLFTAVVLLFFWNKTNLQRGLSVAASITALALAAWLMAAVLQDGILVMQAGAWEAQFGISFVADAFSSTMVLLTSLAGLAVSIFSTSGIRSARVQLGFYPVFHLLLMGLNGAFLTGDIFNLYVWFEIIIIASFVLITLGGAKDQLEGSVKYVTMNLLASAIFLTAIAILYGLTGSLNMADLSIQVANIENRGLVNITALLFLVGFGIKSAIFPLYFWLPASYHTPPATISAIFGGLLTKVGVYAMIRVFTLIFIPDEFMLNLLIWIGGLSILSGGAGALLQNNIRRVFSYLIICHIGYMIAGLGLYTEVALVGAIFYLIHDIVVKTNLFLISGLIYKIKGSYNMKLLGGIYSSFPLLALMFAISFFSLIGIPPLSGFWAKLFLIEGSLDTGQYMVIAFITLGSFITLFVMAKMWLEIVWKKEGALPDKQSSTAYLAMPYAKRFALVFPIVLLSGALLFIGFGAEFILAVAKQIAAELKDPSAYLGAVLKRGTI